MSNITAAQARAISDLARQHEQERADMQERHFLEMSDLHKSMDIRHPGRWLKRKNGAAQHDYIVVGRRELSDHLNGPDMARVRDMSVGYVRHDSNNNQWERVE